MRTDRKAGDFDYSAYFKNTAGIVSRQDQTAITAATSLKLQQGEIANVKLNRKIGPVDWARSAFLKAGLDDNAFRVVAGNQSADAATQEMLSSGLAAAVGALSGQAASKVTASAGMATVELVNALAKLGDAASRISVWVMHSAKYYELVKEQAFTTKIEGIANFNVQTGTPVTLNRPVLVTDDPSLVITTGSGSSAVTKYQTLGLTNSGIVIEDTEGEYVSFQEVLGLEQILRRMQGEYAYNLGLKGFTWDVANGGKNPVAAALATAGNWDVAYTSEKDRAGVIVVSD
ncbi:hypothetical protein B1991_14300 [Rhodanobacter lindaniclasticus]|uniref:Major capsid protein n=2 Tax=Rhodanobacter lindaniclasticus TaxID=75310 RepID=A0A4S3KCF2_9GAMM|nr:hypothetical protein B1991_14300 [Rhodanobacter lindaniclasticus]